MQLHDDMWKQQIKTRKFQVHNQVYLEIMDEYDKQYPIDPSQEEEMYYYQAMNNDPAFAA